VLVLAQEQAGKEAVLKALDTAAASLRGKLGESLNSVQKYGTPLEGMKLRMLLRSKGDHVCP
jgi:hypothetical protein